MPVVLPLIVLPSTVALVPACSMSRPMPLPENTELLTIAFAPPLTVNAATAALCTRTLVSAASIRFTPPAAMRMPEPVTCLTVVSETTSLPPLGRELKMPLPANPSILLFSMTTEVAEAAAEFARRRPRCPPR